MWKLKKRRSSVHCFFLFVFFNSTAVKKPLLPKKSPASPLGPHRHPAAGAGASTRNPSDVYSDQVEVWKNLNPFPFTPSSLAIMWRICTIWPIAPESQSVTMPYSHQNYWMQVFLGSLWSPQGAFLALRGKNGGFGCWGNFSRGSSETLSTNLAGS